MGIYRFKKDGSKLEFLQRTNNNTWGLGFNEQGNAFISTANGNPSTLYTIPSRLYDHLPGMDDSVTARLTDTARIITLTNLFRQVDWVGAFTSAAGHGLYTARTWPSEYWNRRAFVTEPTVQLVAEIDLYEDGSGFRAEHPRNLIASDDEWFSPIMAEVGPDGHVWIADWYNYIIQHNAESDRQEPTPGNAYANPLRDREHGRIYRVVYEDAGDAQPYTLEGLRARRLVNALSHDNMFWRKHAQRLLVENGDQRAVPHLVNLLRDHSVDEIGLNTPAIHALWTLHGLGELDQTETDAYREAVRALGHPSAGVRANAVQVLPESEDSIREILRAGLLDDEHLNVRLKTLNALAGQPVSVRAGEEIYRMLQREENLSDTWIRQAAALAGAVHNQGFLLAADQDVQVENLAEEFDEEESGESLESIAAMIFKANPGAMNEEAMAPSEDYAAEDADLVLELGVLPNVLEFDTEELHVRAGQTVRIIFDNTDNMEHNLLIIMPGSLAEVGRLADEMMASPRGREQRYIPDTPDVIAATPILDPGERYELVFTVPDEPGEYGFVCTIPGHWRIMNGTLFVEP
jgi:uncharacterized protein